MVITKLEDVTRQGSCKILIRKLRLRGSLLHYGIAPVNANFCQSNVASIICRWKLVKFPALKRWNEKSET